MPHGLAKIGAGSYWTAERATAPQAVCSHNTLAADLAAASKDIPLHQIVSLTRLAGA